MLVNNVNQLQAMNTNLSGNYALGRDIDATATTTWNGGEGFVPVGNLSTYFAGGLDGLGHTITGLTINRPSTNGVGLFGYTSAGSTIQNVGLVGGRIAGKDYAGSLVGFGSSNINNSYNTGSVSGSLYVGGLVGENTNGSISNSYNTGAVHGGNADVGGLVGWNIGSGTTITDCYNTGDVSGTGSYVGGLVGANNGDSITDCHNTGKVVGNYCVGGAGGLEQHCQHQQ